MRKILVTSALPYVNNVPHLGNIIGCVLSADVYARFCRLRGYDIIYVCGTDEYGTATETKAKEDGVTPKQLCDKYHKIHKDIYEWFDIKFDKFGRTSTKEQTEIAQDIFFKLKENGYIFEDTVEQLFCDTCDKFLADRFVHGTCPNCGYEDARGDQCDSCGQLLNPTELKDPKCKLDGSTPVVKTTNHLFIDLPKIEPDLQKWIDISSVKGKWTQNSIQMAKAWIRDGLKPRCITRDLKWGTQVPVKGYENKVFYVWFDAPIGYISITANYTKDWKKWWKNPEEVELVQFMGKDNVPFHTVVFPSSLIGSKDNWTMLHHISTTEYLNYEDGKFSKSRNTGVFGDGAKETGIPSEVWRYYLLTNRPEQSDTMFSWADFQEKNNNELLANLGNFVNRTLTFVSQRFDGKIPEAELSDKDDSFIDDVNSVIEEYVQNLEVVHIKDGLHNVMKISRLGNQYFQENEPWKSLKEDKARCGTVIAVCANLVKALAVLLEPYLPSVTEKILTQLKTELGEFKYKLHLELPPGHSVGKPSPLFRMIEDSKISEFRKKFAGKQEFPLDLRVGQVKSVADHPDAEKLYVLKVDIGGEERQLVAGLKPYYTPDEFKGKKIIVVCNLKPAKLRGVESKGMLLAADQGEKVGLLGADAELGVQVLPEGYELHAATQIDFKQFQKYSMKTSEKSVQFKGHNLKAGDVAVVAEKVGAGAKVR